MHCIHCIALQAPWLGLGWGGGTSWRSKRLQVPSSSRENFCRKAFPAWELGGRGCTYNCLHCIKCIALPAPCLASKRLKTKVGSKSQNSPGVPSRGSWKLGNSGSWKSQPSSRLRKTGLRIAKRTKEGMKKVGFEFSPSAPEAKYGRGNAHRRRGPLDEKNRSILLGETQEAHGIPFQS